MATVFSNLNPLAAPFVPGYQGPVVKSRPEKAYRKPRGIVNATYVYILPPISKQTRETLLAGAKNGTVSLGALGLHKVSTNTARVNRTGGTYLVEVAETKAFQTSKPSKPKAKTEATKL